jgi:hypothetical protein
MEAKAKHSKVAALLHTADCSHLHVLVPTVVSTPNVTIAEKSSTQGRNIPPVLCPLPPFNMPDEKSHRIAPAESKWLNGGYFKKSSPGQFYTFDSFCGAGLGTVGV